MKLPRRQVLHLAVGAVAFPALPRIATAQTYPTRTITMIVPFAPGGGTDFAARVAAEHMSRTLGQAIAVENLPGAGGTVGTIKTMRANPDGYTIEMGHVGTHAISVPLYPNLSYKPHVDFEPIGMVVGLPMVIVARKDFPPRDLKEFIAYVKANGTNLNMAHAGVGSITYSYCLLLNSLLGVKPTLIPFKGGSPAVNAIVAGQVDYMCGAILEVAAQVPSGTLKAYAVGADERNPAVPKVPTAKEAGLPEFEAMPWFALFAPKGTPRQALDKLSDALDQALDDQSVRRRFLELGGAIPDKSKRGRQALAALVRSEIARWTPVINAAGAKLE